MNRAWLLRTKSIEQIQRDARLGYDGGAEISGHGSGGAPGLKPALSRIDLTAMGIAAIIGAGIFSTIGNAAFHGGPAVALLFVFTAIACGFAAICYAEFASMLPIAGSAYTYAYASFGELIAWIIGWDLIMEYAIGNIAVAISWSDYFTTLVAGYGLNIPHYLTMDFLTAARGFDRIEEMLRAGMSIAQIRQMPGMSGTIEAWEAWSGAPMFGRLRLVCDLPALAIVVIITTLVYVGIHESKRASNAMVVIKLVVIFLVIVLGAYYVKPENWSPFAPNGLAGVLKGVSGVFFAYIGFDALSTTAEECRDPQRDLPAGMIYSLIICTILYVMISLVLTGMVNHQSLAVGDPLAFVFGPDGANLGWVSFIIAFSAVIAMATVLLVFQLGQPRIWMAMSRDGLLPPIFSAIHPRFRTPWFSTIVTGFVVAVPALFMNLTEVTDLASIGTLFAFVLVCGGVLILDTTDQKIERKFRTPYINSKFIFPLLVGLVLGWFLLFDRASLIGLVSLTDPINPTATAWEVFRHKIPLMTYLILMAFLVVSCYRRSHSLIPVLGLATCGYLMTELGWTNWARFLIWLLVGLVFYFAYGHRHSRLAAR